jgi:hypothetical protein
MGCLTSWEPRGVHAEPPTVSRCHGVRCAVGTSGVLDQGSESEWGAVSMSDNSNEFGGFLIKVFGYVRSLVRL